MATVEASALPPGYLKLGDTVEFGEDVPARCVVKITKLQGKVKLDTKAVDGKSDGTTTNKGRMPGDLEVSLEWRSDDDDVDAAVEEALYQISPRGPNSGQPFKVAFKRSRILGADSVTVEELDGPIDTPGSTLSTAKLKLVTWVKPAQTGQGAAATATTVKDFGGIKGNTVTFSNPIPEKAGTPGTAPPTVKP